jgi:mono/diheme cytochrome c family protein
MALLSDVRPHIRTRRAHAARAARALLLTLSLPLAAACERPAADTSRAAGDNDRFDALEARFRPGLHALMVDLQYRHANLWFAGEAGNWPLADYHMHEIEELVGDIRELHPEYDGIPVGELMNALLAPSVDALVAAVDAADAGAFEAAFDRFTTQCNACHQASERAMIVVQRPGTPPFDNVRYAPDP